MAKHFVIQRKDQPRIDQQYLENWTEVNQNRGEEIIKFADSAKKEFEDLDHGEMLLDYEDEEEFSDPEAHNNQEDTPKTNSKKDEVILFDDPVMDFKEYEDYLMIRGHKLKKPFVEKPLNAEDHEVKVYYSSLNPCGSGYNVLFRKTNNFSGKFIPQRLGTSVVRTEGSYIYEEFLPTDGFDIKIYTVGADYAHAEARKCPTLDGVV
jgi:hypothetical protein